MPTRTLQPIGALPLPDEVLSGWAEIPTTIASDVSGGRLLMDPNIRPLRPLGGALLLGPAVTAWCEPGISVPLSMPSKPPKRETLSSLTLVQTSRQPLLASTCAGLPAAEGSPVSLPMGAVRDIAALAAWSDFPVFALGHTARGPVSFDRGTVNDSIVCGGVPIRPRDLVLGDDDGLIVIPRDEAEQWLAKAREKVALEQEWDRRLSAGESMLRVFGISEP